ncbi:MAG: MFS transporter [Pseudomonadota bacterium]|nr:MFS transporter [Pseudomonadota bacterium]
MGLLIVSLALSFVIWIYFNNNPLKHTRWFMWRRFFNWFPLGMTYAFLYMGRYNLAVSKNALGTLMSKEDFGIIFAAGTTTYALSFLVNGPFVDKNGGKKGIIIGALGSALANILMGVATYLFLHDQLPINLVLTFSLLYSLNMYFQSYGAVSIIKVKSYWFHVRERGTFGAIFGTLISFGVYFAFDWGQAIIEATKATTTAVLGPTQILLRSLLVPADATMDATWLVFFIPAVLMVIWAIIDKFALKDSPDQAGFDEFDPHDASSGEVERSYTTLEMLKKIFSNRLLITIALVEFTSGVIRNGILQWYLVFGKEMKQPGSAFFIDNWGLLLCVSGIVGGFLAGTISDSLFHSRRGPPAAILNAVMLVLLIIMSVFLFKSPTLIGFTVVLISTAVIGVHSLLSGTASADFGGRKATATASGIIDGFVYLGSGVQSLAIGYISGWNWQFWPVFLIPFTVMGLVLSVRFWKNLPEATKSYLINVEKRNLSFLTEAETVTITEKKTLVISREPV